MMHDCRPISNEPKLSKQTTNFAIRPAASVCGQVDADTYSPGIKYNGISVISPTGDVCKDEVVELPLGLGEIKTQGLTRPQAAGIITLEQIAKIATTTPSGNFEMTFSAKDDSNAELLCVLVDATF